MWRVAFIGIASRVTPIPAIGVMFLRNQLSYMMNCNTKQQTNGSKQPTNSNNNNTWNNPIYVDKMVKIKLN
jgi:hypothetical protein